MIRPVVPVSVSFVDIFRNDSSDQLTESWAETVPS